MANLEWTGINDNTDTGEVVEAKLNTSFSNAEDAITATETSITAIVNKMNTYASLSGLTAPVYSLTTTPQDVVGFSSESVGYGITVDSTTGIINPTTTGIYEVTYTGDLSFTSVSSTRFMTIALNNGTTDIATSVINIPRDASRDSESLTMMMPLTGGTNYNISISASENMSVTFNAVNLSFKLVE